MLESDDIWNDVRPFMNANNDKLFVNLRDIYREGIPRGEFSKSQLEGSKKALLHTVKNWWKRVSRQSY